MKYGAKLSAVIPHNEAIMQVQFSVSDAETQTQTTIALPVKKLEAIQMLQSEKQYVVEIREAP